MKSEFIPLPEMLPGREYIIKHINNEKNCAHKFKGYGLLPGTKIKFLFSSPSKDPRAYEIMGTVIALRAEDSKNIFVSPTSIET